MTFKKVNELRQCLPGFFGDVARHFGCAEAQRCANIFLLKKVCIGCNQPYDIESPHEISFHDGRLTSTAMHEFRCHTTFAKMKVSHRNRFFENAPFFRLLREGTSTLPVHDERILQFEVALQCFVGRDRVEKLLDFLYEVFYFDDNNEHE